MSPLFFPNYRLPAAPIYNQSNSFKEIKGLWQTRATTTPAPHMAPLPAATKLTNAQRDRLKALIGTGRQTQFINGFLCFVTSSTLNELRAFRDEYPQVTLHESKADDLPELKADGATLVLSDLDETLFDRATHELLNKKSPQLINALQAKGARFAIATARSECAEAREVIKTLELPQLVAKPNDIPIHFGFNKDEALQKEMGKQRFRHVIFLDDDLENLKRVGAEALLQGVEKITLVAVKRTI